MEPIRTLFDHAGLPVSRYCHRNFAAITTETFGFLRHLRSARPSSGTLCPLWTVSSATRSRDMRAVVRSADTMKLIASSWVFCGLTADAVMVGSGTLHATAPDHLWIPEYMYPKAAEAYRIYRQTVLSKACVSEHGDCERKWCGGSGACGVPNPRYQSPDRYHTERPRPAHCCRCSIGSTRPKLPFSTTPISSWLQPQYSRFCARQRACVSSFTREVPRCSDNLWRRVLLMSSSSRSRRKLPAANWNDHAQRWYGEPNFFPRPHPGSTS